MATIETHLEEISHLDLPMTQVLELSELPVASGGWSDIYQGFWLRGSVREKVALKVIRIRNKGATATPDLSGRDTKALRTHWEEIALWLTLDHANIHPLLGLYWGIVDYPALVSPWSENGDVMSYVRSRRCHPKIHTLKLSLLENVMGGLKYLHDRSPPIVHGDLKGANILVSHDGTARIADFGLSRVCREAFAEEIALTTAKGTYRWMAPELLATDDAQNTTESDVWAAGCVLLEVLSDSHPYLDLQHETQVIVALGNKQLPLIPPGIDDKSRILLLKCLEIVPEVRPVAYILHHRIERMHYTWADHSVDIPEFERDVTLEIQSQSPKPDAVDHHADTYMGTWLGHYKPPEGSYMHHDKALSLRNRGVPRSSAREFKVALKSVRVSGTSSDQEHIRRRIWTEIRVWRTLDHAGILPFLGIYWTPTGHEPWMVAIFPEHGLGNLRTFLQGPDMIDNYNRTRECRRGEALERRQRLEQGLEDYNETRAFQDDLCHLDIMFELKRDLVQGIIAGLQYMHSTKIVHGNIWPESILINEEGVVQLSDFSYAGVAECYEQPTDMNRLIFMAPELVTLEEHFYTTGSDVWSCGCVIHEIITGHTPYDDISSYEELSQMMVLHHTPTLSQPQPVCYEDNGLCKKYTLSREHLYKLHDKVLIISPAARPSLEGYLHPGNVRLREELTLVERDKKRATLARYRARTGQTTG